MKDYLFWFDMPGAHMAGVVVAVDFGYSFGNRVKFLRLTPETKSVSVGVAGNKGDASAQSRKNAGSAQKKLHRKSSSYLFVVFALFH